MSQGASDIIREAWFKIENGKGLDLTGDVGAPSYAIRGTRGEYIVALPLERRLEINEEFSSVRLTSQEMSVNGGKQYLLLLTYVGDFPPPPYSALCAEFLGPGVHGQSRQKLLEDPVSWWRTWKELLGNENVELRVYDVLGELCVLRLLSQRHPEEKFSWCGPRGASYDIQSDKNLYEVKSTIVKGDKRVVVHNAFQLDAHGVPLHLMHCVFEPSTAGVSVNDLVTELIGAGTLDSEQAEACLGHLGLAKGRSARDKKYILHSIEQFEVDTRFPLFEDLPPAVVDLEYTLELAAFDSVKVL